MVMWLSTFFYLPSFDWIFTNYCKIHSLLVFPSFCRLRPALFMALWCLWGLQKWLLMSMCKSYCTTLPTATSSISFPREPVQRFMPAPAGKRNCWVESSHSSSNPKSTHAHTHTPKKPFHLLIKHCNIIKKLCKHFRNNEVQMVQTFKLQNPVFFLAPLNV